MHAQRATVKSLGTDSDSAHKISKGKKKRHSTTHTEKCGEEANKEDELAPQYNRAVSEGRRRYQVQGYRFRSSQANQIRTKHILYSQYSHRKKNRTTAILATCSTLDRMVVC